MIECVPDDQLAGSSPRCPTQIKFCKQLVTRVVFNHQAHYTYTTFRVSKLKKRGSFIKNPNCLGFQKLFTSGSRSEWRKARKIIINIRVCFASKVEYRILVWGVFQKSGVNAAHSILLGRGLLDPPLELLLSYVMATVLWLQSYIIWLNA